jgi:hypothetical protein
MIKFAVSTAPTVASNLRYGIYKADSNFQPTGAPIYDSGDIPIGTTAAVYQKALQPLVLQPGAYLSSMIVQNTMTLRVAYGGFGGMDVRFDSTSPYYLLMRVPRTYGAYPTPGVEWLYNDKTANGPAHPVFFRFELAG